MLAARTHQRVVARVPSTGPTLHRHERPIAGKVGRSTGGASERSGGWVDVARGLFAGFRVAGCRSVGCQPFGRVPMYVGGGFR